MHADKKVTYMNKLLCVFCSLMLFMGCNKPSMKVELDTYEHDIEREPKATYELLKGKKPATAEDRARHTLLTIKAKNLAYVPLEARDTVAVMKAIGYYLKQRDAKQVMLGYYLLGSIYRDIGDAPRGVEAFTKVVENADTTKEDCDYRLMARAEGQKSDLQMLQNILAEALASSNRAEYYSWQARDTAYAFDCAFESIGINALMQNFSPLINHAPQLINRCISLGDTLLAVRKMVSFAWNYLQIDMVDEAAKMITLYDHHNGRGYPIYYGTKGELFLAQHLPDSAEWCFRKELEASDWNNRQTAYRGLKKVFELQHQTDSALKYATFQCEAVDSDYQQKVSEDIVRMEQLYNYEAEKEKVRLSEDRQQQLKWMAGLAGLGLLVVALTAYAGIRSQRERHRRKLLQQQNESSRLKAQLADKERALAQEEARRKEAEGKAAQLETYVMEVSTELKQLERERDEMQQRLSTFKKEQENGRDKMDSDPARIHELEQQLQQKDKDIQEVKQEVERKKKELLAQQEMMDQMQSTIEEFREEARSMENYGDAVQQMRRQLKDKKHATVRNWQALQKQVVKLHPTFVKSMRTQVAPLLESELRIAMLIKMGFQPREIALLMDRSPQMVSMSRRRLYAKAFGKEPEDLKDVDEWIMEI